MTTPSKGIAGALLEFQKNAPHIALDATNPHFRNKYASLAGIVAAIRGPLNEAGLVLTQMPTVAQEEDGDA